MSESEARRPRSAPRRTRGPLAITGTYSREWSVPGMHGSQPWSGVRYVAVAGSPQATHAVDVSAVLDKAVSSLQAHRAYLDALGDHPMASPREFLEWMADLTGSRFGGRPAAAFELFVL